MTLPRVPVLYRIWAPLLLSLLLQNTSIAQAPTTPAAAPTSGTPPASAPSSAPAANPDGSTAEATKAPPPPNKPVRALVLLNADFNERGAEAPEKLLRYPDIPTFDLITSVDESEEAYAALRVQISKKVKYKTYVSRRLMPLNRDTVDDQEDVVTKSIRGFLTQHAKGVVL